MPHRRTPSQPYLKHRPGVAPRRGAVLLVALVLLLGITLLGLTAMSTSTMELRMAGNIESKVNNFQTVLAAIDYVLSDDANLPVSGPLKVTVPVDIPDTTVAFAVKEGDSVTATATRLRDCGSPPRMRAATSMKAYSAFEYEVTSDVNKNSSGAGTSGAIQGFMQLGPKC